MKIKNVLTILVFIAMCQTAGIIGSWFTMPAVETWYVGLHKPGFNPPSWVFGPVWFVLYTIMGVAAAMIAEKGMALAEVRNSLTLFFTQLVLNCFWSVIFFGMKSPKIAFMEIIVLWMSVLVTTNDVFVYKRGSADWFEKEKIYFYFDANGNLQGWKCVADGCPELPDKQAF